MGFCSVALHRGRVVTACGNTTTKARGVGAGVVWGGTEGHRGGLLNRRLAAGSCKTGKTLEVHMGRPIRGKSVSW